MLMLRKIVFFLFLFVGLSLFAQQDYMVSSYVRGNFLQPWSYFYRKLAGK